MAWKYKTFHYLPRTRFLQKLDKSWLENKLNLLSKLGWEYIEKIDCNKSILSAKEYIIVLRGDADSAVDPDEQS